MDTNTHISWRVRELLAVTRTSRGDLAAATGITVGTLAKRLQGVRPWSAAELVAVADALDVAPAELLPRQDSNLQPADYRPTVAA